MPTKPTKIFVNLPVANLPASMALFKAMGFKLDKTFTDENAACVIIGENIFAMLLTHGHFKMFTPRKIANANTATEVLVAVSFDSKAKVDKAAAAATKAGATEPRAGQDHGFMYSRAIADLDGHIWELIWTDEEQLRTAVTAQKAATKKEAKKKTPAFG